MQQNFKIKGFSSEKEEVTLDPCTIMAAYANETGKFCSLVLKGCENYVLFLDPRGNITYGGLAYLKRVFTLRPVTPGTTITFG